MRAKRVRSLGYRRSLCAIRSPISATRGAQERRWHSPFCTAVGNVVVAIFVLSTLGGYHIPAVAQQSRAPEDPGAAKPVKVVKVVQVPMERTITALGSLAAYEQATVSVKVPGRIKSVAVDLGSVVRRGQIIAQIEAQDYQLRVQQSEAALAQSRARLGLPPGKSTDQVEPERTSTVRQARALLDEAKAHQERSKTLFEQGILSEAQLGTAEAGYKVALSRYEDAIEEVHNRQALLSQRRSELEIARQQLADTIIYAPFDGAVQEKRANLGEYLAAGAPIATIVRIDPLRLRIEVPERDATSVRSGQQVRVTVEGDNTAYRGHIARLSPTIATQSRMLLVEAEVSNSGALRPGAFVHADIIVDTHSPAVAVPTAALVTFAGVEKVLIVQNGKALEKIVTTRRRTAEWVEIISGVNVGDTVVVNPGTLQPGQAVTVVE